MENQKDEKWKGKATNYFFETKATNYKLLVNHHLSTAFAFSKRTMDISERHSMALCWQVPRTIEGVPPIHCGVPIKPVAPTHHQARSVTWLQIDTSPFNNSLPPLVPIDFFLQLAHHIQDQEAFVPFQFYGAKSKPSVYRKRFLLEAYLAKTKQISSRRLRYVALIFLWIFSIFAEEV